jgi:hypothetical protein
MWWERFERRRFALIGAPVIFLMTFAGTCIPNVYSPPATLGPLERTGGAAPGQPTVGVYVAPAGVAMTRGDFFDDGASLLSGGAFARQAMRTRPVIFSESISSIRARGEPAEPVHQHAYTGRLGVARAFALGRTREFEALFSLHGGIGGGYSTVGSFFAPDLGMTFGWKGKRVIPFFATLDAGVSTPFRTRPFFLGNVSSEYRVSRETDVVAREILSSQWYRISPGAAARVGNWQRGVPMFTLAFQAFVGQIRSSESVDVFAGAIFSFDVQLDAKRSASP